MGGLATGIHGQDVVARGILASMATGNQQPTGVTSVGHPVATCQLAGMLSVNYNKTEMILFTRHYKPEQFKEGSSTLICGP